MSGARSARRSPNELFSCGSCNERRANRRGGHRMSCFSCGSCRMLPQYWLEVRAILLRNDDRLIVGPKLNMKTLGVISAAIWARAALISQTIYVRCFDYRKRACSCRRWTRRLRSTRGVAAAAWLRRRVPLSSRRSCQRQNVEASQDLRNLSRYICKWPEEDSSANGNCKARRATRADTATPLAISPTRPSTNRPYYRKPTT